MLAHAFQGLYTKVINLEQVTDELPSTLSNDDAVRLGYALQPGRKVRRLAYDATLLSLSRADQIANHHKSRGDAYARLESRMGF
jgi:hypothetical protein